MTLRLVTASIVTLPFMIKLGVILRGQSFCKYGDDSPYA